MDHILNDMIDSAYQDDPSQKNLDRVVSHLQGLDIKALPLWQQFNARSFLFRTITLVAHHDKNVDPDTGIVKSEFYKDGIDQLLILQKETAYNGGMSRWLAKQRRDFAYAFSRHPDNYDRYHQWDHWSTEEKLNFSQRFIQRMMGFYFRDLPVPPMPKISIPEGKDPDYPASLYRKYTENGHYIDFSKTVLFLSPKVLQSSYQTMSSLVHEGTHLASNFLGYLESKGLLDSSHPAHDDARKSSFNDLHDTSLILELYDSDSEEMMAFEHQDKFFDDFFLQAPSLKTRFLYAIHNSKQALEKIGAAMAPIINNLPRP